MKFIKNNQLLSFPLLWVVSGVASVFSGVLLVLLSFIRWLLKGQYLELFVGFWIILVFADSAIQALGFSTPARPLVLFILSFLVFSAKSEIKLNPFFFAFIPFAAFSLLTSTINFSIFFISIQKAISYLLLLIVVPSFLDYLRNTNEVKLFRTLLYTGYTILGLSILLMFIVPTIGAAWDGRLNGIFRNPNGIGMFTALFGMLTLVLFNYKSEAFSKNDKWIAIILIGGVLLLSGSRNSMVSLILFAALAPLCRISNLLGILSLIAFGLFGFWLVNNLEAIIAGLGYGEFFRLDTLDMASGRIFVWEAAWLEINSKFFWVGEGFAYSDEVKWMDKYYEVIPDLVQHNGNIHNAYLTFWINTGLVGVLLFFVPLIGYIIKAMFKSHFALPLMVGVGFMASFESWLTASLNPFTIVFFMILTLLLQGKEFTPAQKEVSLEPKKAVA